MRVSVIGCGSIGRRHIGNLLELGCDVYVTDPSAEARQRTWLEHPGARLHNGEPVDAVVIATPWDQHLHLVEYCFERWVPFFVEKPLGSLEQLPRWRELAQMALPVNQVGYQLRFHPLYQAMRTFIPRPLHGTFRCDFDMATWPGKAYGPAELEASHELDLALDCGLTRDNVVLNNGAVEYYRWWAVSDGRASASMQFTSAEELGDQMYVDEMAHFLECVREGKQTICPLSDGLRVLEALSG